MLTSLFPFLRFWVPNLPDPDALLLTSGCLAAHFYLLALRSPRRVSLWLIAGLSGGVLALARPEGILYCGLLGLGLAASRPRRRELGSYLAGVAVFLLPMVYVWEANFGFLWPQNYNGTLGILNPVQTCRVLAVSAALVIYQRGIGLFGVWVLPFLAVAGFCVLLGLIAIAFRSRFLLPIAVAGIGNTVAALFTSP